MIRETLARHWSDWVQSSRGWDYRPALRELEASQWLEREQVEQQSLQRLRELLHLCEESVPFYRDAMRGAGIRAADVREIADLRALPAISKAELRADYAAFRVEGCTLPSDTWSSSGSTGAPFFFELDRRSIAANTFAALARGRRWWGIEPGSREAMIWSGFSDLTGTLGGRIAALRRRTSWALKNITTIDVYLLDDDAVRQAYAAFARTQPRFIRAIASGLLRFCTGVERLGLDGRALGVEAAIYTGEGLSQSQRQRIESVLGCRTVCEYGCTELGIIAFECPQGGLHLCHENHIVEFIVDQRPARPGEVAELVVTNLNDRVRPLLRYKVGDFAAPSAASCPCGRTLPLIQELGGRVHDVVRTPRGRTIHGLFFTHLFDRLPEVSQFRVIQRSIDAIEIQLVVDQDAADRACRAVAHAMHAALAEPITIEVRAVSSIANAPSGKTRWIESALAD